ncbi:monocarboxylate transporter 5 [Rhipicephalus sanguineus]|uniref:monocarboxylate transporter 5 n=1 Tax=Rhipicephalus sanguineus TaxID=34632 RepID=UPI0020C354CB|nr:monocarboxylate transporter 5 [Rhipicephalus sanguineus]
MLFYGVLETFRVSRQEASWSVALAGTVLVLAGCALSGMYVAANVLVAQHFEERRAVACSLVYTVSGLNNVVLPPLVEFLQTTYGVRGAFLLYGAILLNAIPPIIILRSPPWLTKSKHAPKMIEPGIDDASNVTRVSSAGSGENGATTDLSLKSSSYSQTESECRHSASPSISTVAISSRICLCEDEDLEKVSRAQKVLSCLRLGPTAKQFLTWSFLVNGLSFAAVFFTAGVFVLIPADLAGDRGLKPSQSVYVLQAFSTADIVFRAVVGVAIDYRILSIESAMLLGFVVQGAAYEWLVWTAALPPMIAAAFFMGATCGSRLSLQAPALVQDFGISTLPTMMGGVSFCAGVSLLARPVLIGYYRDTLGNYNGLLHSMAALNAFFVCMWTAKLIVKRITALKMQAAENKETSRTDLQHSGTDAKRSGESSAAA